MPPRGPYGPTRGGCSHVCNAIFRLKTECLILLALKFSFCSPANNFKIPHLLSESRYEIIQTDLNRKVGIFEKRGKFSALSDGKQFSSLMILTMTEKVLSIFIDESGRFQYPDDKSRFYIISMVMHDQSVDITQEVSNLEQGFRSLHLSNLCFHAGPLIRQEKIWFYSHLSGNGEMGLGLRDRVSRLRGRSSRSIPRRCGSPLPSV